MNWQDRPFMYLRVQFRHSLYESVSALVGGVSILTNNQQIIRILVNGKYTPNNRPFQSI